MNPSFRAMAFVVIALGGCVAAVDGPGADCASNPAQCATPLASCATDLDCGGGLLCVAGTCAAGAVTGDACGSTIDCSVDDFCDAGVCRALPDGLCRTDSQCAASNARLCAAEAGRVDRCVMCRVDADCGDGVCFDNGNCAPPAPSSSECPAHASPLAGTDTCRCDDGFQPDASGACVVVAPDAPPTVQCVEHASPTPGIPGQCRCDPGFEASTTAAECVAVGSTPPGDNGNGGSGSGDGGGDGSGGSDNGCGDNAFPLFFLCVCFPGHVVDPSGAPGCVADTSSTEPTEPTEPTPTEPTEPSEPPVDDAANGCPAFSSPDPSDDTFCLCDDGYVVNDAGDACEEDACATLGYYGDGEFCDDFCALPDPDCSASP